MSVSTISSTDTPSVSADCTVPTYASGDATGRDQRADQQECAGFGIEAGRRRRDVATVREVDELHQVVLHATLIKSHPRTSGIIPSA